MLWLKSLKITPSKTGCVSRWLPCDNLSIQPFPIKDFSEDKHGLNYWETIANTKKVYKNINPTNENECMFHIVKC